MLDRLTRLERSNRRWKRGTILAACAAILVVGAFAGSPTVAQGPRTVSAQRFVLLSPSGRGTGATFEFSSRGPEVVLYDPGDRPRLRLGIDQHGPGVELLDSRGNKRGSLGFFDGEPGFVLYDAGLRVRAILSIADNRPSIVLLDENKRPVFQAP
jgi:hypothetical protein